MKSHRQGLSLLELIVAVAIIAVLIALLLPAIQSARLSALLTRNNNNYRQILLGLHSYESSHAYFPGCPGKSLKISVGWGQFIELKDSGSIWVDLIYQIDSDLAYNWLTIDGFSSTEVAPQFYYDPADLSLSHADTSIQTDRMTYFRSHKTSYLANWQVFGEHEHVHPSLITDGRSNTIGFATTYGIKCGTPVPVWRSITIRTPQPGRAVFADGGPGSGMVALWAARPEWYPMDYPVPTTRNTSRGSRGRTFLIRPSIDDCEYRLPVSSYPSGLPVAMLDGSVRLIRRGVSEEVFWSQVTPAAGDLVSD